MTPNVVNSIQQCLTMKRQGLAEETLRMREAYSGKLRQAVIGERLSNFVNTVTNVSNCIK